MFQVGQCVSPARPGMSEIRCQMSEDRQSENQKLGKLKAERQRSAPGAQELDSVAHCFCCERAGQTQQTPHLFADGMAFLHRQDNPSVAFSGSQHCGVNSADRRRWCLRPGRGGWSSSNCQGRLSGKVLAFETVGLGLFLSHLAVHLLDSGTGYFRRSRMHARSRRYEYQLGSARFVRQCENCSPLPVSSATLRR